MQATIFMTTDRNLKMVVQSPKERNFPQYECEATQDDLIYKHRMRGELYTGSHKQLFSLACARMAPGSQWFFDLHKASSV